MIDRTTAIRALHRNICTRCTERPSGSERWSDDKRRPCEAACQVFVYLPALIQLAEAGEEAPRDEVVLSLPQACGACGLHSDTGHCTAMGDGTCPLCRFSDDVLATLRGVAAKAG